MNAYELADEAKRQSQLIYLATEERVAKQLSTMFNNYANMLCQQADKIAELEKVITNYRTACDMQEEVIKKLEPQTKPLSDEEILELRRKHRTLLIDGSYKVDELALCRAIEAKVRGNNG